MPSSEKPAATAMSRRSGRQNQPIATVAGMVANKMPFS